MPTKARTTDAESGRNRKSKEASEIRLLTKTLLTNRSFAGKFPKRVIEELTPIFYKFSPPKIWKRKDNILTHSRSHKGKTERNCASVSRVDQTQDSSVKGRQTVSSAQRQGPLVIARRARLASHAETVGAADPLPGIKDKNGRIISTDLVTAQNPTLFSYKNT